MRRLFGGEGGGKPRRERGGVTGRQAAAAGGTLVGRVALPQFWEEPSGTDASTGSGESAGSTKVARGWGQHGTWMGWPQASAARAPVVLAVHSGLFRKGWAPKAQMPPWRVLSR